MKCLCGKNRNDMNGLNWKRHVASCEVQKRKKNNTDISAFITSQKT